MGTALNNKSWRVNQSLQLSSFIYNINNGTKLISPLHIFNNCIHCGVFKLTQMV